MPVKYSGSPLKAQEIKYPKHLVQNENFHVSERVFPCHSQRRFSLLLHPKPFKAVSEFRVPLGRSLRQGNPLDELVMLVERKYNSVSSFVPGRGDLTDVPSQQDPFFFLPAETKLAAGRI